VRSFIREGKATIMARLTLIFIVLTAVSGAISQPVLAQTPLADRDPATAGLAGTTEPDPLPGLPRPPDRPNTLFQPALATTAYGCPELECPYFEPNPYLDPCCLHQPGWLWDVELDLLGTHVVNEVGNSAPPFNGAATVPIAKLDWAVAPKFEAGYRLPSGFGEFDVNYRFLLTQGAGTAFMGGAASPDAAASLTSHLDMNVGDADYASVEFPVVLNWIMKWRIGLRTADLLFTSEADEPFAAAAGGSGFFQRTESNNFWGIGPHAAVELTSERTSVGLGLVGKLDTGILFGKTHQKFAQIATAGPAFDTALDFEHWQQVPMVSGFVGLDWRPASHPNFDLLLGTTAEYWWNVGLQSDNPAPYNNPAAGEIGAFGATLRLEYNY
jgi:hypothetical protein